MLIIEKEKKEIKAGCYPISLDLFLVVYGVMGVWPIRVLDEMPEIIPRVQPRNDYAGTLFRDESVNEAGRRIPHAKINIEYLNYRSGKTELGTTTAGFVKEDIDENIIFADGSGSFSFISPRKGFWTFTLMDGDNRKTIRR